MADGLGIAPSTLHRILTGVRRGPSPRIVAQAAAWLSAHEADDISRGNASEQAARLSTEQRERLAFLAQHQPEIRRDAHVSRAELEAAIAGEALEPAVIVRLSGLLLGEAEASG
jgi:hypothetical protein